MHCLTHAALILCLLHAPGAEAADLSNLNFITTPQGPLGNLLARTGCVLTEPPNISFHSSWGQERPRPGEFQLAQIIVDCDIVGPRYFTHGGLILFFKDGQAPWRPFSFLASRIARYSPGAWFIKPSAQEREAFQMVTDAVSKAGRPPADATDVMKQMERENDGSMIRW